MSEIKLSFKGKKGIINPLETSTSVVIATKIETKYGFTGDLFLESKVNSMIIDLETSFKGHVYEIGFMIVNKDYLPVKQFSLLIEENLRFVSREKYADYLKGVEKGLCKIVTIQESYHFIKNMVETQKVKKMYSYNTGFDFSRLKKLYQGLKNPFEMKIVCLWKTMKNYLLAYTNYVDFCYKNAIVTAKNKPKSSLESVIKYLTDDIKYEQDHTALSDLCISVLLLRFLHIQNINVSSLSKKVLKNKARQLAITNSAYVND